MNQFSKSEIQTDYDLIAKDLKRAREERGLGLEEVSRQTKINLKYLRAIESGDFSALPSGLYARKFLKQYAKFLSLNIDTILEAFDQLDNKNKKTGKKLFSNQVVNNKYFLSLPALFRNIFILMIVASFFTYLAYSFQDIRSAPELVLIQPAEDFITEEKSIIIEGYTENDAEISINGESILVNLDSSFKKELKLKEGINEIIIEASKKYGKTNIIKRQILVK
ncbi:hypothetical protein C0584_00885 [Candidatus Parcubacteria bacterium]|nr:MAG: hypothetical protein C0584_00885 [Candidatus Parcubacteria bacterium]